MRNNSIEVKINAILRKLDIELSVQSNDEKMESLFNVAEVMRKTGMQVNDMERLKSLASSHGITIW